MSEALRPVVHAVLLLLAALAMAGSAWALGGTVIDDAGEPIQGALACYMKGHQEQFCSETDAAGHFELPSSEFEEIRVFFPGYLPRRIPAVQPSGPVALELAAILLVRVRDATTQQAVPEGEIDIVYSTGRRRHAVFNAAGSRIRTLEPGPVRVVVRAEGYTQERALALKLVPGEETEVVIDLEPSVD